MHKQYVSNHIKLTDGTSNSLYVANFTLKNVNVQAKEIHVQMPKKVKFNS